MTYRDSQINAELSNATVRTLTPEEIYERFIKKAASKYVQQVWANGFKYQ